MRNFIILLLLFLGLPPNLHAQTPYYQGKTIRFIVGYPAGSTHDLWARLVAPASPNTPAEHVKTLRAAFTKAVNDPDLLAEAKKKTIDVELITGEETEALAKEVVNQPADIVARLKKLLGE